MSKSRVTNSVKNAIYGCLGYLIGLLLAFVSKHQFIKILGSEFNGLNGLFTNILNILNLVELGFGGAIVFALYLPLKNQNHNEISKIINYIKKIYIFISVIIFLGGILSISFLKYLIHEDIKTLPFSLSNLYLFYLIFLIHNSLNFLVSHRRILILADQKNYHVTNVDNSTTVLMHVLQIVMLVVVEKYKSNLGNHYKFTSYMVFLGLLVLKTLLRNIGITIICNKYYPYLNQYRKTRLEKEKKSLILQKVKSMTFHKSSEAILNGSTTIIISTFIGITQTGIYGNYMMIALNLVVVINIFYNALIASIGNLAVSSNLKKQYDIFNKIHFLTKLFAFIIFVSLYVLLNDFIEIWIKSNIAMTFDKKTLFSICFFTYLSIIRKTTTTFRDAKGLFSLDAYKSFFEVIIGIPISIILAIEFGVIGAVSGYCYTVVLISIPTETRTLFKFGFKVSSFNYHFKTIKSLIFTMLCALSIDGILSFIPHIKKFNFLIKLSLTLTLILILTVISSLKTPEFKYYINLISRFLKRKKEKKIHT